MTPEQQVDNLSYDQLQLYVRDLEYRRTVHPTINLDYEWVWEHHLHLQAQSRLESIDLAADQVDAAWDAFLSSGPHG